MKRFLALLLTAVAAFAQPTTPLANVRFGGTNNQVNSASSLLAASGGTLGISNGGTFTFNTSSLFSGDAAAFRAAIGAGTGGGSVTSVSVVTANGVSGSVANPTTTPAITLTLGAITPTSVQIISAVPFLKLTTGGSEVPITIQGNNDLPSDTTHPYIRTGGGGSLIIEASTQSGNFGSLFLAHEKNSNVFLAGGGGNVGVGISGTSTMPTYKLQVNGTLSATTGTFSGLTSGRIPFSSTGGLLIDDSDLTFATDTLTVTKATIGGISHVANAITSANSVASAPLSSLTLGTGTFGTSVTFASATGIPTFATHVVIEGVTSTGATGTGNFVFSASPTLTGTLTAATANLSGIVTLSSATASSSTSTGALVLSGSNAGMGVAGNVTVGGALVAGDNTDYPTGGILRIGTTIANTYNVIRAGYSSRYAVMSAYQDGSGGAHWVFSTSPTGGSILSVGTQATLAFSSGATSGKVTKIDGALWRGSQNYSIAAWGTSGGIFRSDASTITDNSTASGTVASAVAYSFAQPTFAATNAGITTTDAATIYIAAAPAAGTNMTITNGWGLWNVGKTRLDGIVSARDATEATTGGAGSITTSGGLYATKAIISGSATDATSITTGGIIGAGGLGITKAAWIGGLMNVAGVATMANTTEATNSTTAGTVISGGLGVAKKIISASSYTSGAPTAGSAGAWKFGANQTGAALVVSTTNGIRINVDGTDYTLAVLTTNP